MTIEINALQVRYGARTVLHGLTLSLRPGRVLGVVGPNGSGKSTLVKALAGQLLYEGTVQFDGSSLRPKSVGYMPQDPTEEFAVDKNLTDWMGQWTQEGDDDQAVRSSLGRLLFSGDDVKKSVKVLSGGEKGRMIYGKLMLGRHNVMLLDEPTNHMDMESIESLNIALEKYAGTQIFVSHDREFVSSLATRVLEIKDDGIVDFQGSYEDYLSTQGIE